MSTPRINARKWAIGAAGVSLIATALTPVAHAAPPSQGVVPAAPAQSGHYVDIPQDTLVALTATSEELQGEKATNSGPIGRVLDGDYSTFWHSKWQGGMDSAPHSFVIATKDEASAASDIGRITLGTRQSSSGSGRAKDVEVYASADRTQCGLDDAAWELIEKRSVPATDKGDQVFTFDARTIACVKVTYLSAWDGSNNPTDASSLAEFNLGEYRAGPAPLPTPPEGTPQKNRPLPAGATSSADILNPLALDDRRADNPDKTPIALKIPGWEGQDRIIGARTSPIPLIAAAHAGPGKDYHVDCAAPDGGTGTIEAPFNTLAAVNDLGALNPGDRVLLKRGTTCVGLLRPLGSGTAAAPIEINAYGNPADPAPILHGNGQSEPAGSTDVPTSLRSQTGKGIESAVVRLFNQEYITIRNLEITNYTSDGSDYSKRRRGVVVALEDYGQGRGYKVENLYIHDVLGRGEKDLGGSGGIQFEAYAGPQKKPTSFAEIEVAYNAIRHVNRSGINEGSDFRSRPSVGGSIQDNPFTVWGAMDVHDNIVSDIGGDAIVTQFASHTKVYNNTVWQASNHHGGRSPSGNNAAVWPWDADFVHYYHNHVFDTVMPNGTWDGTAFDADYGTTGTIFEYNVTHDNEGGFMLFCGCGGLSTDTVMRYNLSINDGRGAESHNQGPRLLFLAGQADGSVYHNTFLLYPNVQISKGASQNTALAVSNNVLLAQGQVRHDWTGELTTTNPYRNNLYAGTAGTWPQPEQNLLAAEARTSGTGLAKMTPAADLIAQKSIPIGPVKMVDLAHHPVPDHSAADLGALQVGQYSNLPAITNGGFEKDDEGWTLADAVRVKKPRNGAYALDVNGGTASTTVKAGINRTYRLVAAVQADAQGNVPALAIVNSQGHKAYAEPLPQMASAQAGAAEETAAAGEWMPVSAYMRTAFDASDLTVQVSGTGLVDDIALEVVEDYMVDGSFQSYTNTVWSNNSRTEQAVSGGRAQAVGGKRGITSENNEVVVPKVGQPYLLIGWAQSDDGDISIGAKRYEDGNAQVATPINARSYEQKRMVVTPQRERFTAYCYSPQNNAGACDDIMLVDQWDGVVAPIEGEEPEPEPTPEPTDPTPSPEPTDPTPSPEPTDPTPTPEPEPTPTPSEPGQPAPTVAPTVAPSHPGPTTPPPGGQPPLPITGASGWGLLALASGLLGGGALLVRRRVAS